MRFVHTSDWHLGKILHQRSLLEDQVHALDQLFALLEDARPDALIIAGDVYDRAVPPGEAVKLLGDFLSRVILGLKLPIVMIAGNHDSPERLGFGAELFRAQGLTIAGPMNADLPVVTLEDEHGPVVFHPLPYADPATVHHAHSFEGKRTHQAAMEALVAEAVRRTPSGARSVCVAHAFVQGGSESDSERPLTVGGSGLVDAEVFAPFDYVALGHLHRPQKIGRDATRYSGSLLKYSFSEAEHPKGVELVELGASGEVKLEHLPITPLRDLGRVEGKLADLIASPDAEKRDAYLEVTLTDEGPIVNAMAQLREVYPHVLELRRTQLMALADPKAPSSDALKRRPLDIFADFYRQVGGDELDDEQRDLIARAMSAAMSAGESR